jgi:hypothetical protein
LVVGNADDSDIVFGTGQATGIADYLPQSEEGVTLFTTRTIEVAVSLIRGDVLELGLIVGQEGPSPRQYREGDLSIAQAAAYLNRTGVSIAKYLQLLQHKE